MSLPQGYPADNSHRSWRSSPPACGWPHRLDFLSFYFCRHLQHGSPARKPTGFEATPRLRHRLRKSRHVPSPACHDDGFAQVRGPGMGPGSRHDAPSASAREIFCGFTPIRLGLGGGLRPVIHGINGARRAPDPLPTMLSGV